MHDLDLQVVDLARELLFTALDLAGPVLLVGLVVGVAVSLFQALTSVQEQTMSMVPKMLAVIFVALVLLAPALGVLRDYAESIFARLNTFGLS
jgi:flagellar biosynthetic protein FliQ